MKFKKSANLGLCEGCIKGKMHRKPFPPVGVCSSRKLQLVHSDACGSVTWGQGNKYFVTFINDYSCCCMVYFLKHKSDKFKEFEAIAANNCGCKIGRLKTDNGVNCTLMGASRSMISHAKLNSSYWGETVATAAYVRNCTVTTVQPHMRDGIMKNQIYPI